MNNETPYNKRYTSKAQISAWHAAEIVRQSENEKARKKRREMRQQEEGEVVAIMDSFFAMYRECFSMDLERQFRENPRRPRNRPGIVRKLKELLEMNDIETGGWVTCAEKVFGVKIE